MTTNNINQQINELEKEIAFLPSGSITKKRINDNICYYHRFVANGKRKEKYIDFDSVSNLMEQIEYRKKLQKKLNILKKSLPKQNNNNYSFHSYIRIQDDLLFEIKPSKQPVPEQYRHLIDKNICCQVEHHFGKIIEKCVIYSGITPHFK